MAVRTSEEDVEAIVEVDPAISVSRFILIASRIVDRVETCGIEKEEPYTAGELLDMETLVAAHLYTVRDQRYTSKSTLRASGSFEVLSYLDQAKLLDHAGCLEQILTGRPSARMVWLGRPPSAQTDYADRD